MKIRGTPELVWVAIRWDDLWLEAKYQPSSEIAGSPRKVYRDRPLIFIVGGRAPNGWERVTNLIQSNSEYQQFMRRQSYRAKLIWLKGNIPDFRLRPLNLS